LKIMEDYKITALLVTEEKGNLLGVIHIHDVF
jgi:CBS domain-containing protein